MDNLRQPLLDRDNNNNDDIVNEVFRNNPVIIEREDLLIDAGYKLNGNVLGVIIGAIVYSIHGSEKLCDSSITTWYLFFTGYCILQILFLCIFIYTAKISNLFYSVCSYPFDIITISFFIYGFTIFTGLSDQCALEYPFPYYLMLLILIIQLATFLKYISCGIVICICLPLIIYVVIKSIQERRNMRVVAPWEEFENRVFNNLEQKTFSLLSDQQPESCCICLVDFNQSERIIILPCNAHHHFHIECIRQWVQRNRSCPLCKYDLDN